MKSGSSVHLWWRQLLMHVESVCNHSGAWKQSKIVHYTSQVLMQRLSDQKNSYSPFPQSVHKAQCTDMKDGLFLIIHWHLHWFSGQIYTEQSRWHQLNNVFLCAGLQRQQNVYYIILLYKILIFTEEAFELKGYFQWLANQCCISLVFSSVYLR